MKRRMDAGAGPVCGESAAISGACGGPGSRGRGASRLHVQSFVFPSLLLDAAQTFGREHAHSGAKVKCKTQECRHIYSRAKFPELGKSVPSL